MSLCGKLKKDNCESYGKKERCSINDDLWQENTSLELCKHYENDIMRMEESLASIFSGKLPCLENPHSASRAYAIENTAGYII